MTKGFKLAAKNLFSVFLKFYDPIFWQVWDKFLFLMYVIF